METTPQRLFKLIKTSARSNLRSGSTNGAQPTTLKESVLRQRMGASTGKAASEIGDRNRRGALQVEQMDLGNRPQSYLATNIAVIPTPFVAATLWESGSSKVEPEFFKTQNWPRATLCASFEYLCTITSQLGFTPVKGATVAVACRILRFLKREAMMDLQNLSA